MERKRKRKPSQKTPDDVFLFIIESACHLRDGRDRVTKAYRRLCAMVRMRDRKIANLTKRRSKSHDRGVGPSV